MVYRKDSARLVEVRESWCCVVLCTREMYGPLGSERNHILVDRGQLRVQTGTQAIQEPVNAHTQWLERDTNEADENKQEKMGYHLPAHFRKCKFAWRHNENFIHKT